MKRSARKFADRFNLALNRAGFPRHGKGQQAAVAKAFGVKQASVSQWLRGENFPEMERVIEIAKILKISIDWLLYGTGEPDLNNSASNKFPKQSPTDFWTKVPLLTWEEAADWETIVKKTKTKEDSQFAWSCKPVGPKAYALALEDDSLMPAYQPGTVMIVDPAHNPKPKELVIYLLPNTKKVTCKQLIIDGKLKYLARMAHGFPAYQLTSKDKFCGTVRQVQFLFE